MAVAALVGTCLAAIRRLLTGAVYSDLQQQPLSVRTGGVLGLPPNEARKWIIIKQQSKEGCPNNQPE